ncbi:MAG TPA: hypothetical protein VJ201_06340, partial [Candidatus Babeliales bacterium]|nr:hypothetical protein [Candidatus Babeliales bacterium]
VVHARRLGISTLNCSFALWDAIFHSFITIYLLSDRLDTLNFSIDRLRFMWSNLPAFITNGLKLVYNNKQYMEFDNGSRILFGRADISITRGLSVNTMICDNFAFISLQRAEEFWITLHPSIPISGKIILTSAYNPESNLFNKIWRQSEKGLNTFKRHQLLFYDVTDKDANDFIEDPV